MLAGRNSQIISDICILPVVSAATTANIKAKKGKSFHAIVMFVILFFLNNLEMIRSDYRWVESNTITLLILEIHGKNKTAAIATQKDKEPLFFKKSIKQPFPWEGLGAGKYLHKKTQFLFLFSK